MNLRTAESGTLLRRSAAGKDGSLTYLQPGPAWGHREGVMFRAERPREKSGAGQVTSSVSRPWRGRRLPYHDI
jgi:hypothetical protein